MSDYEQMDQKVFLNKEEVSKEKLQEEMKRKDQKIIKEDDTHYRKLDRMNG